MAIDKVLRGIPFLRQELTKIFMKRASDKSGIMQIPFKNKKLQLDIEDRLQKYILDAQKQGVDLDMVSNENLKYTINLNENVDPISRAISADSPEGKAITDKLFGKKGDVVDMTGKKIDTSQGIMGGKSVKELMESGQVQKGTDDIKISEKITDRDMFKNADQRLKGPIKGKMDMGEFGKVDVETDYSASINRKEFFDPKAKNMYDKTVKTGPEFFKAQKEQILNTINRKKKEMVPTTHSNYKLLKKSLQDQEDALEAIKVTEDLGGNENMFDFLRTKNIADYKSKPLKRSDYVKIDEPEDFAYGGVAGLLGERQNFAMGRRAFMKLLGGAAAGIGAAKAGLGSLFKAGKPIATKIVTPNVAGKPVWFDDLVNKVIKEGDDVTKQFATKDREIVHATKIGDDEMVTVTRDLDEGAIRVEYNSSDNMYEDTVQLQYKKPLPDENNPRPAAEFDVAESGPVGRRYGPDDFEIEIDEVGGNKIEDLTSDVSKLKEYATGKKPTIREFIQNKKRRDKAKDISAGGESEADEVIRRQGDYDYANGGLANMLGE